MRSSIPIGIALMLALAACSGQPQQQADATQPAATQDQPATTSPAPVEPAPSQAAAQPEPSYEPPPRPQPARTPAQRPAAPGHEHAAAAAPAPEPEPSRPAARMVSVPSGTILTLALDQPLNSKTSLQGDVFTATVLEPILLDHREVIAAGSKIEGKVTEAVPAKRGAGNAKLGLSFDVLRLASGYQTNIVGSFQELTESKKKRNAAIIGGSAAGGALLGRILGKDTKGAVVGAILGGGIGTAVVMGQEGQQAKLPADTPFEIRLEEPIDVPEAGS